MRVGNENLKPILMNKWSYHDRKSNILLKACLFFAPLILYGITFRKYYTGFFIDDAMYLCMAQSIINGHYSAIFSPIFEPILTPFPGYPILLSIFVKVFHFWDVPPKILSVLFTMGTGIFVFFASKSFFHEKSFSCLTFLLFSFNSMVVRFSGTILSEPAFMFLSFASVFFISQSGKKEMGVGGLLMGTSILMRPQGFFLLGAMILVFLRRKEQKKIGWLTAMSLPFLSILFIQHDMGGAAGNSYFSIFSGSMVSQLDPYRFWINLKGALGLTFLTGFLNWPSPSHFLARKILAWTANIICLFFIFHPIIKKPLPLFLELSLAYVGATLVLIPFWFALDERYFYVLIPFICFLFIAGLSSFFSSHSKKKYLITSICAVILFFHIPANTTNIKTALNPSQYRGGAIPKNTFLWIRKNTSPDSHFLCLAAPTLYLYTNRKTLTYFPSSSNEAFLQRIHQHNIKYVLLGPWTPPPLSESSRLAKAVKRVEEFTKDQSLFQMVYSHPLENTTVYKVPE